MYLLELINEAIRKTFQLKQPRKEKHEIYLIALVEYRFEIQWKQFVMRTLKSAFNIVIYLERNMCILPRIIVFRKKIIFKIK